MHHCKIDQERDVREDSDKDSKSIGIIHGILFIKSGTKSQGRILQEQHKNKKTCNTVLPKTEVVLVTK